MFKIGDFSTIDRLTFLLSLLATIVIVPFLDVKNITTPNNTMVKTIEVDVHNNKFRFNGEEDSQLNLEVNTTYSNFCQMCRPGAELLARLWNNPVAELKSSQRSKWHPV